MRILAIETSCDETAVAVVEGETADRPLRVISNVVASSQHFHKKTGGIVPEIAARKQVEFMVPVISKALKEQAIEAIDAIAVTVGPGLVGSLLVGVESAKALAFGWNKPIIPVNHLVGHLYANWIEKSNPEGERVPYGAGKRQEVSNKLPQFPAVGLVASGGHTDLVLMKGHGNLSLVGSTRDDAAGEAFDKIARMLGLGFPGGPAISAEANKFTKLSSNRAIKLPRPMLDSDNYDFSFSGLKTAVVNVLRKHELTTQLGCLLAYETQEAICEVLVSKLMRAVGAFAPKSVLVAGGVAANLRLRETLSLTIEQSSNRAIEIFIPPNELCTDNAAYIAAAAFYNHSPTPWRNLNVDPGLTIMQ